MSRNMWYAAIAALSVGGPQRATQVQQFVVDGERADRDVFCRTDACWRP